MKVLIFGGTTEGRKLSAALSNNGINVTLSVATEYGRHVAVNDDALPFGEINIHSERLTVEGMIDLLKQDDFDCVVDATHPYAVLAAQNIRSACEAAGLKYLKLKRPGSANISGLTYVSDTLSAVEILKRKDEKVLLTIGSKELEPFTKIENYAQRFFVRILQMTDSLNKALDFGFRGSNIICMQGPFDEEMNTATLKMTGAKVLVTKESGDAGGFEAKVSAALSLGCEVIVIARPIPLKLPPTDSSRVQRESYTEESYTIDELLAHFGIDKKPIETHEQRMFPLFVDMNGRRVLVIGGGNVAERRLKVLADFGAEIIVIAPVVTEYIEHAASLNVIRLLKREYKNGDIAELMPFFVIAATDRRQVNHEVMVEARSLNIRVSVADNSKECSFYFPAIAESETYIAALVSKNGDHAGLKQTAKEIRTFLNS